MSVAHKRQPVPSSKRTLYQVGYWAAVLTTLFAVLFTVAFSWQAASTPPSDDWQGLSAYAASFSSIKLSAVLVPSLLLAPSFVALMACVHGGAPVERQVWTRIGLGLAIMYAVIASVNYTIQLVVVRGNLFAPENQGLSLFVMGNPRSIFWALALIGYNFYMALAAVCVIPSLGNGALERWIGWLFSANAVASLTALVIFLVTLNTFHVSGLIASAVWCLGFPAATILMAIRYRRLASS